MTTDPGWQMYEFVRRVEPTRRAAAIAALCERIERAFRQLGARQIVAYYWTSAGVTDTPRRRANGFWKARKDVAGTVPSAAALEQEAWLRSDGLHFLASARTPLSGLGSLVTSVHQYERSRACVFVPLRSVLPDDAPRRASEALAGARFEYEIPRALHHDARAGNFIVLLPFGRFDDPEAGLVLAGPDTLGTLVVDLHALS